MSLKNHIETRFKLTANPLPKAPCGRGMSHIRPREKKLQTMQNNRSWTDGQTYHCRAPVERIPNYQINITQNKTFKEFI